MSRTAVEPQRSGVGAGGARGIPPVSDRYVPERMLGEQAAGRFLVAIDTVVGGRVTVLVPRLEGVTPRDFLTSLRSELHRSGPLIDTPYCTLRDAGLTNAGEAFVVVSRPQGASLTEFLRTEGHIDPDRALAIAIQTCELVRRAHAVGIAPVAPEPGRIILDPKPDGVYRVSIVDLGLHRNAFGRHVRVELRPNLFDAPQQRQRDGDGDPRDDVFSVAAVFHAMVFGVAPPPMSAHGPADGSGWATLPDGGRGLDRRLEACLHTVLLKGLSMYREERFARVEGLQRALTGLRQLMSVSAPAFELLAATRSRLGQQRDAFDVGVERPEQERAAEARARVRQVVAWAREGGANLASLQRANGGAATPRGAAVAPAPPQRLRPGAFVDFESDDDSGSPVAAGHVVAFPDAPNR